MSIIEQIAEQFQETLSSLSADLETGSHHRNNGAGAEFIKRYPNFMKDFTKLGELIKQAEDNE